ncbi:MAG: hypothetical protein ACRD2W_20810, partial [Acidimicrobiales bacterium]
ATFIGRSATVSVGAGEPTCVQSSSLWKAAVADYFETQVFQNTGGSSGLDRIDPYSPEFMAVELVGPSARATMTSAPAAIGNAGNPTLLTWTSTRWADNATLFGPSSSRMTADRDGPLLLWANIDWATNATGSRRVEIWMNGAIVIARRESMPVSGSDHPMHCWTLWDARAGDYFEVKVWQDSGAALSLNKLNDFGPEFGVAFISEAPFSPAHVAGMQAWFKADSLGLADGAAVGSWADSSTFGRHATQGTAAKQPTFKAAIVGGKPVVRFDGVDDTLQTTTWAAVAQPTTIFVVAKAAATAPGAAFAMVLDDVGGAARNVLYYSASSQWLMHAGANVVGPAVDLAAHIFALGFNGAASKIRVGGGAGVTGDAGAQGFDGLTLGNDFFASFPFNGDIAEVVAYAGLLSLGDLDAVGGHLAAKYGLSWVPAT